MADKYIPRSKKLYDDQIVKGMTEKFGYKNHMEVPSIEKIVLNMGVGEATQDKKKVTAAAEEMALIAGQKPVITKAKKVHRAVQAAGRHAHWRQSHIAARAYV